MTSNRNPVIETRSPALAISSFPFEISTEARKIKNKDEVDYLVPWNEKRQFLAVFKLQSNLHVRPPLVRIQSYLATKLQSKWRGHCWSFTRTGCRKRSCEKSIVGVRLPELFWTKKISGVIILLIANR